MLINADRKEAIREHLRAAYNSLQNGSAPNCRYHVQCADRLLRLSKLSLPPAEDDPPQARDYPPPCECKLRMGTCDLSCAREPF